MVPTVEGDHQLALRLDIQPAGFSVGAIDVNGEAAEDGATATGDQRLPVSVYTRYSVSQATVDALTAALRLLGFLVTLAGLPFLLRLFRKRRGATREGASTEAGAPPPGRGSQRRRTKR